MHYMVSRQGCRALRSRELHKGAYADKDAENIFAGRWGAQVRFCSFKNKFNFLLKRFWLQGRLSDWSICRTDDNMIVPGDGKHDPAIARVRHHDGAIPGQNRAGKNEVDSLAWGDHF